MKKVLFAISDSFPFGAAYSARTRALCKLVQLAGYETVILCDYTSSGSETNEYGIIYSLSDSPYTYTGLTKLIKLPNDYGKKLDNLLNNEEFDFVIVRSMFDRFDRVLRIINKHRVPVILESCEWYDVKGFARRKLDIRYWQFKHCFSHSYNKVDGVIAISRLLENHYREMGLKVIRIPGIHEVNKLVYRIEPRDDSVWRFLFAGNIFGGKEQFNEFVIALSAMQSIHCNYIVNVYGPTKESIISSLSLHGQEAFSTIENKFVFHGKVSQEQMAEINMDNDFGVFFRPNRRSSNAGFPTKLGEYLSAGTPVITNNTGDISDIVANGVNGYLINDASTKNIKSVMEKALSMNFNEYRKMRVQARLSAESKLSYSLFQNNIMSLFNEVKNK